jgi:hypothetical protein
MRCFNCGAVNDAHATFCSTCGSLLQQEVPGGTPTDSTPTQPMPPGPGTEGLPLIGSTPPPPTAPQPPLSPPTAPRAPGAPSGGPKSKGLIWAAVVLAIIVAGVLVWVFAIRGGKKGATVTGPTTPPATSPAPSSSPTASASSFPDANEAALLAHVPSAIAPTCSRYDAALGNPIAAIICRPSSGAAHVQYSLFASAADMTKAYANVPGTGGISGGDCSTDKRAEAAWFFSGNSTPGGRLECFQDSTGHAAIYWTFDSLQILTWADRNDTDNLALYQFWLKDAGPNA